MGTPPRPTLTATIDGTSVTFGGVADVGQVAGILVDGISYAYRIQAGDTPQSVAANLAAMARDKSIVRLSHGMLTIAGAGNLLARVVADASVRQEVRRQEQGFRITCWCPSPATRDFGSGRDRSGPEWPAVFSPGGWGQRQSDLHQHRGIRSVAERQTVSA